MSSAPSPGGLFALSTAAPSSEEGPVFDLVFTTQGDQPPPLLPHLVVSDAAEGEGEVPAAIQALVVTLLQSAPTGPQPKEPEAIDRALHELSALLHAHAAPPSTKEATPEQAAPLVEPEDPFHRPAEANAGALLAQPSAPISSPLNSQALRATNTSARAALGHSPATRIRSVTERAAGPSADPLPERESDTRLTPTEPLPSPANEATRGPRLRGASALHAHALLPPSPPPRLLDQVRVVLGPQLSQALIRLDPPGLGALRVHVQEADGELSAQIEVERPEVLREIERLLPQLHDAFAKHGQAVGRIEVSLNTAGFTAHTDGHAQPGHDPTGDGAAEFGSPPTGEGSDETATQRTSPPPAQGLDTLA